MSMLYAKSIFSGFYCWTALEVAGRRRISCHPVAFRWKDNNTTSEYMIIPCPSGSYLVSGVLLVFQEDKRHLIFTSEQISLLFCLSDHWIYGMDGLGVQNSINWLLWFGFLSLTIISADFELNAQTMFWIFYKRGGNIKIILLNVSPV